MKSVRSKPKPAPVVRLDGRRQAPKVIDWEAKHEARQKIRNFDRAGFNEFNSPVVAKLKRAYFRAYGEKI
ncbi:MAG: hypothetical protein EOQ55_12550 [Mesorhizobium sp.]|uniref:hypothetical protein n=1 Tax=Mesorhizobium sp. TaxID=1871066 RepID=UPI000FE9092B|nr:hypothetical protein [Mesorhizobium sp.]RWG20120.1 MAG: hypothetical protein EOQ55_12550 [Mesorhizobium sp.]RWI96183.1 MAG: hypothetical protein EOR21_09190 [Mesorhizobium sp.]